MFAKSTVAVALLASFVAAQTNLTFDPSTVNLTIRSQSLSSPQFLQEFF
jgi:hypothetical protein